MEKSFLTTKSSTVESKSFLYAETDGSILDQLAGFCKHPHCKQGLAMHFLLTIPGQKSESMASWGNNVPPPPTAHLE